MLNLTTLAVLLTATIPAYATPASGADCPHPYKPQKPKKPRVPKKPAEPPVSKACDCPPGKPGKPGEQGPPGVPGKPGHTEVVHMYDNDLRFPLDVGLFATGFANGDWAWGPALQLGGYISKNYQATLMGGLAGPFTSSRESGYTLRAGLQRDLGDDVALGFGLGYLAIDGSKANGNINGDYWTLDVAVTIRRQLGPVGVRLNLMPVVLGFADDTFQGKSTQVGSAASLFAGVRW